MGLWPFVFFDAVAAAVGRRRALALTITGELFNAAEALRIGLVHQVVPIEDVDQRAFEVAQTVANYSSHALCAGLGFVHEVEGQTWKAAAGLDRVVSNEYIKSTEFRANLAAFLNQK